ncbi:MAG TPA: deoxyribodipyrimidine photo-lyase [Steroidobacteraceae bacterium]|nr:deoxyribodipyrimidine photo-lyase [Steroidobacteraceae bacterium]
MQTALVWFRRDFRLTDHAALAAALGSAERIVPVYIHAPEEDAPWAMGAASRWWLHHTLAALGAALAARGAPLAIFAGPSAATLLAVARATGASSVHWNRRYEPAVVARDTALKAELRAAGLAAESHPGDLLLEPWSVANRAGEPFRVFTPFLRACQAELARVPPPRPPPATLPGAPQVPAGVPLDALRLLPRVRWDGAFARLWRPGEAGALARLEAFVAEGLAGYAEWRDRPDLPATSRLSPHLHFGELSPRQVLAAVGAGGRDADAFVRELLWREFAHHLLYAFPHTTDAPLDARFADFPWPGDPHLLGAWQRGATGVPLVDAGMRELWHTGFMHNRVRMVVASFLTKNLGLPWQDGARWFHDTLLDADLANNTLGWQWTAGCGADAAPYYRIFSPLLQAERFDPERSYLRAWLPELARLPNEWLHRPFEAPPAALAAAGVRLGVDYPWPIVDLASSRKRALAAWQRMKSPVKSARAGAPRQRR